MNLLFAIDENVLEHLKKAIYSIKLHNDVELNIYIVHDSLKEKHIKDLTDYINSNNLGKIRFIKFDGKKIKLPLTIEHTTRATYYKLFAPFLVDDVDKILYLDYDIVCTDDIQDFYNSDFQGKTIVGVVDFYLATLQEDYINAGVMLIDVERYKERTSIESIINYIEENYDNLEYQDQTVLNEIFRDDIEYGDDVYNYQVNAVIPEYDYGKIVHYAYTYKPWTEEFYFPQKAIPYYQLLDFMGESEEAKRLSQIHFKKQFYAFFDPDNYSYDKTMDIIMPSYNATSTIRGTLDSILEQELFGIKLTVLLIDDCSQEDYMPVYNEYKDKLNIKYYRMDRNSGVALARQRGMDEGDGDFFTIIDSDDHFISPYAVATMYFKMLDSGADVVRTIFLEEKNYDYQTYKLYREDNIACHGKCYRKQFLKDHNIRYLDMRGNEDTAYNALVKACNAKYEDPPVITYFWCDNPNSFTRGDEYYHEKDLITFAQGFAWTAEEIIKRKDYLDDVPTKIAELLARIAKRINDCWYQETMDTMYTYSGKIYFYYRSVEIEPLGSILIEKYEIEDNDFLYQTFISRLQEEMYKLDEYKNLTKEEKIAFGELYKEDKKNQIKVIEKSITDNKNKNIVMGKNSIITGPLTLDNFTKKLYIGDNVYIDSNFSISGDSDIYIGNNSKIGKDVSIITNRHPFDPSIRDYIFTKKVFIGNNTYIGNKTLILGGSVIGENTYIEDGSVVLKSIDSNSIASGNPCEKKYDIDEYDKEFYDQDKKIIKID